MVSVPLSLVPHFAGHMGLTWNSLHINDPEYHLSSTFGMPLGSRPSSDLLCNLKMYSSGNAT
uniref:MORPHEUS MOLECULE family protein n=1 Tax=Rhizophora mucronata TaxID=61149 RepID=A0A2P2QMB8_RHIMU